MLSTCSYFYVDHECVLSIHAVFDSCTLVCGCTSDTLIFYGTAIKYKCPSLSVNSIFHDVRYHVIST